MGKLAELGFRFSLDKVLDLDLDFQDLARSDVKFVKLGAQALIDELVETEGRLVLRSLPDLAAEDFANLTRLQHRADRREGGERAPGGRRPRAKSRLRPGPPVRRAAGHQGRHPRRSRPAALAGAPGDAAAARVRLTPAGPADTARP